MPFENAYGGGGLLTTTGDLLIWNQALDEGRLGARVTAQLQEQGRLDGGKLSDYGRGLFITEYRGAREVSHGGVTLGYVAFVARFPAHKVSVAVLCNRSSINPNEIAHHVADQFLPSSLPLRSNDRVVEFSAPAPVTAPGELWRPGGSELRQLSGRYRSDEAGATYLAQLDGDRLVLRLEGHPDTKYTLSPTYRDRFAFLGGSVTFKRTRGRVTGMSLSANRLRDLSFVKVATP
jgi:CubicO group peptidase (beta-lactamase class C family)